jgi:pimeloyl-ACP methyl ester carboxylesterase
MDSFSSQRVSERGGRARLLLTTLALAVGCSSPVARIETSPHQSDAGRAPAGPATLCRTIARDPYAAAASRALAELFRRWLEPHAHRAVELDGCRIVFEQGTPSSFAPDYFDSWVPASDFTVRGLPRQKREGVGVALLAVRENRGREEIERHYPPEAITRAVTAIARPGQDPSGRGTIRVQLLSALAHEVVNERGRELALAGDFTVPWAALLERAGELRGSWLRGFVDSSPPREPQLYLTEPYDPHKTPLLLIHGLLSTPITWAELTNELWGNPEIRRRYQVWHYLYPTSAPFLYSARTLRRRIAEVERLLASRHSAPPPPMVVIAHSMGGLLAKTLITSSDEEVWKTVFTVPVRALRGRADDLATVNDILHWRARSDVRRVIFVAVPHRGSDLSAGIAGRLADKLTGVPPELVALYTRLGRDNPGALTPAFERALTRGELTSIDPLTPRHPLLPVLASLPTASGVAVHSILGDRGGPGPLAESSDGVVDYRSSHLEGAESELVVPTSHRAFEHPLAVSEIERILLLP